MPYECPMCDECPCVCEQRQEEHTSRVPHVHASNDDKVPPHNGVVRVSAASMNWQMLCGLWIAGEFMCSAHWEHVTRVKCLEKLNTTPVT